MKRIIAVTAVSAAVVATCAGVAGSHLGNTAPSSTRAQSTLVAQAAAAESAATATSPGTKIFAKLDCPGPGMGYVVALQQVPMPAVAGEKAANPYCSRQGYTFVIPATEEPPEGNRRAEVFWGNHPDQKYTEGQTLVFEGQMSASLGASAREKGSFHFVWQAHGPKQGGGMFARPLIHLDIVQGRFVLGGGDGHPQLGRSAGWWKDLGPYRDNRVYTFRVEDTLSSQPEQGEINVWINGEKVMDAFTPESGTYYPGTAFVQSRGGLYRGSPQADAPTYEQKVNWKVLGIR